MIIKNYSLAVIALLLMSACSQTPQRSVNHRVSTPTHQSQPSQHAQQKRVPTPRQRSQRAQVPQSSPVISQNPLRNHMVSIAKNTIGTHYKWGGNNPQQGFDCSGLMSYVHKNALDIKIPRTAAKQRDQSRTINYAQLQPGDMLFFKTGRKTNHVGVYIGDRKFIHAPSGGKRVKVASMDIPYWHKRFVKFGTFVR